MVEANIWGLLFYRTQLEIELGPKTTGGAVRQSISGIHLYHLVGYLLAFTEHAKQMISRLGYEGPLSIEVTLSGILGIHWLYAQEIKGPASELDDAFSFSVPTTTDSLKARRDAPVRSMLQSILFGTNWADYASDSGLAELLRNGYEYNYWPKPATLQL